MPLVIFAGGEIVLALIAARIVWWIVRSGGFRLEEDDRPRLRPPDPPPTRHPVSRPAVRTAPPERRRSAASRPARPERLAAG